MPHHHVQHAQNMGPNLFARNENIAYVMPGGTTCAVTSYACVHIGEPASLCIRGAPGITYGHAACAGQTIFIKINHLTF